MGDGALHLDLFEQPGRKVAFGNLLEAVERVGDYPDENGKHVIS
jgi:hypothetical protein